MNLARLLSAAILALATVQVAAQDHAEAPQPAKAWTAPDREMMVPVEGGNIYVRINGEISAEGRAPAIFIHGGPGGTHSAFAAMLALADERPVILYDQLGSGKSDRPDNPANWKVERFIDELETVRKAVGAGKLHLLGFSWGAALALEYAARYPDHTASAVLGATYISTTHWITDANILVSDLTAEQRAVLTACESNAPPSDDECSAIFTRIYSRYYRPKPRGEDYSAYRERFGGQGFNPVIYNAMWGPSEFSSTGTLKSYDATLRLLDIDGSQTLFLIGQYDSARIDTVQEFVALTPGAELAVVPGGGHGFLLDRPLETEAILRGWMRRKDAE